jgi:ABC-2 type transport system permease protein
MYPLSIFPRGIQMLLTFLVPVGFISFYPALDFVGPNDSFALPIDLALFTPAVGAVLFLLAYAIFHRGLKRYESAGS